MELSAGPEHEIDVVLLKDLTKVMSVLESSNGEEINFHRLGIVYRRFNVSCFSAINCFSLHRSYPDSNTLNRYNMQVVLQRLVLIKEALP